MMTSPSALPGLFGSITMVKLLDVILLLVISNVPMRAMPFVVKLPLVTFAVTDKLPSVPTEVILV